MTRRRGGHGAGRDELRWPGEGLEHENQESADRVVEGELVPNPPEEEGEQPAENGNVGPLDPATDESLPAPPPVPVASFWTPLTLPGSAGERGRGLAGAVGLG
ncbi:hypothetical protein [Streptomyces violascens]|uniref:hypothetical protein n=1 Tax=Streptomyces violascens TaxID=67381 RepID=UPI00367C04EF